MHDSRASTIGSKSMLLDVTDRPPDDVIVGEIDTILTRVGEYGRYQKVVQVFFMLSFLPECYADLIMYFAAKTPDWTCVHNSTSCNSTRVFPAQDERRCAMTRDAWEYVAPRRYSLVTEFDLHCERAWQGNMTTAMYFVGGAVGVYAASWWAENYGRRAVIFPALALMLGCGLVCAFSQNIWFLLVIRFLSGFFICGVGDIITLYMIELVTPKKRALATQPQQAIRSVALCILSLVAYLSQDWRKLMVLCTAPYLFVLAFRLFVAESPRWCHGHGRNADALQTFMQIAHWNQSGFPPNLHLRDISDVERISKSNATTFFSSRTHVARLLIISYAWFALTVAFYGTALAADDLGGSTYAIFATATIVELPALVVAVAITKIIDCKKVTIGFLAAGCLSLLVPAFSAHLRRWHLARITLGVFSRFLLAVSYLTWSNQLFVVHHKKMGVNIARSFGKLGAAISPFVVKSLKSAHACAPLVTISLLGMVAAILLTRVPENDQVGTHEASESFEDDGASRSEETLV